MKKIISIAVCIAMCISMICSINALADNKCGDNATWDFAEGVLTISGNGPMYDFDSEDALPWYSIRAQVEKIIINDGITYIGNMAFYGCVNAKTAQIPESVKSIGLSAFSYTEGSATSISNVNADYVFSVTSDKAQVKEGETFYITIALNADFKNVSAIQSKLVFDDDRIVIDKDDWCDKEWLRTIDETNIGYISDPAAGTVNNSLRLLYISTSGKKIDDGCPLYTAGKQSINIAKVKCTSLVDIANIDISCFYLKDCKIIVTNDDMTTPECSTIQLTSATVLPIDIEFITSNPEILEYKGDKTIGATKPVEDIPAEESDEISVYIDGVKLEFDVNPILVNDRTLVPMRKIFEYLGAKVFWDDETSTAFASKDDITICFQIGNTIMTKNNDVIQLDVPAQLVNDRTLVPLRAVSEAFGCTVEWIEETQSVIITTK